MMKSYLNVIFLFILILNSINLSSSATVPNKDDTFRVNITMKNYDTTAEDQYVYIQYELPDEELFIVGYSPLVNMNSAHHMLTYACDRPNSNEPYWVGGGPCNGNQIIIHGWARNAPPLNLPEDVAFAVGRNTPYRYIVVNIHYLNILKNDFSGNQLIMSRRPRKYRAGVILGGTGDIYIQPHAHTVRTPFSCNYREVPLSIFAVRVHAHQWGRVNSLYRIRDGQVTQIAKGDPHWAQSFYPLASPIRIEKGDILIGQCVYDSDEDRAIHVGSTHNDEMCNVYSMYSYDPNETTKIPMTHCWGDAAPQASRLIPADSVVPPLKPADMSPINNGHDIHAEHAMQPIQDIGKSFSPDDQSYEDYVDEVEHSRSRNRGPENADVNRILSHLGLPQYEYIDADNYDHLLPKHLTYGKEQTVKIHNGKQMTSNVYTNVDTWPNVKTLPRQLGEIGGIALTNKNDELVVFSRGSRKWEFGLFDELRFLNEKFGPIKEEVLMHIDTRTGDTKYKWGANMFYMPHGLTIDSEGNFWLTDIAMHQVLKFKPNDLTHPVLTVGELFQHGSGPNQLCRPADVAVMKNGDFFVADGYCNSRIVKFNRKGEYLTEWGSPPSGKVDKDGFPLPNEWNVVHSIALNEESQIICGADRENFRIQCFDMNSGQFLRQIRVEKDLNIGAIYAIEFAPNTNGSILFAVTGGVQTETKKVYMIDAKTGDILTSFQSTPKFNAPHDITVSSNGREVYVGELALSYENALHKFEISKQKELPSQTFIKQIYNNDKNFRVSLIIMIAFASPVVIAVIIGCILRIRNMRKVAHMNDFLNDIKTGGVNRNSMLGNWFNRRQGFERLEQCSDGENELFETSLNDDSNNNSGDETMNVSTKTPTTTFKMGESL